MKKNNKQALHCVLVSLGFVFGCLGLTFPYCICAALAVVLLTKSVFHGSFMHFFWELKEVLVIVILQFPFKYLAAATRGILSKLNLFPIIYVYIRNCSMRRIMVKNIVGNIGLGVFGLRENNETKPSQTSITIYCFASSFHSLCLVYL